jgi:hypothetical protein
LNEKNGLGRASESGLPKEGTRTGERVREVPVTLALHLLQFQPGGDAGLVVDVQDVFHGPAAYTEFFRDPLGRKAVFNQGKNIGLLFGQKAYGAGGKKPQVLPAKWRLPGGMRSLYRKSICKQIFSLFESLV